MFSWLLLDLNSYFASCEQQANPKLRGKPIGVIPLQAETTVCLAASNEAKKSGVKTGIMVKDARKMCPGIQFIVADHGRYIEYHHKILKAVETCVPIEKVLSIDEVACKLTGSQRLPENAEELSLKLKKAIYTHAGEYLKCSIGLATNMFLAKVASDMKKPDGLTALFKQGLPNSLFHLKLRDMPGIGKKMEERLNQQQIFTMQQLCSLSILEIKEAWGSILGEHMYLWLRGEETGRPPTKTKSMGHEHVLEPEFRNFNDALSVTKKLLLKGATRLRKENFYTKKLNLSARFLTSKNDPYSGFDQYINLVETQDSILLLEKLELLWGQLLSSLPHPKVKPIKVGISFSNLIEKDLHQFSFFEDAKRETLMEALDEINSKFGKNAVYPASIHEHLTAAPTRIAFSRVPDLNEVND